jgi:hypothetical protein
MKDEERTKEQLITELQNYARFPNLKIKNPRLQAEKALSDSDIQDFYNLIRIQCGFMTLKPLLFDRQ